MPLASLLEPDILLFLVIGLLGGAHCIGMCGPLVTIYADRMRSQPRSDGGTATMRQGHLSVYEVRQHALFNIGRAMSYTVIGAMMGALGGLLYFALEEISTVTAIIRGGIGIGIGGLIMVMGVHYLLGRVTPGIHLPGTHRITHVLTNWIDRLAGGPGILGLGAVHGLLPCPILYPAYLYAFATGSPLAGGIALAALGVGTIPAVFLYGTLIQSVDAVHRRRLHQFLGIAFLVLGYVLLAHGLLDIGIHVPHPELPFWDPIDTPEGHGHDH